ncbi:transposase IS66 [Mesorhizobium alhagi CCNWXJ12-2]|uniref:Transposase IS66 n=1 Tax=Mesorhizobium alhagi CCNWXJ12-2 TaxID=1107882 RepID=H0I3D5_9HYPH|nr:transposase IS66 [Mesorhizobium alhagi CCNWXJ12-2]
MSEKLRPDQYNLPLEDVETAEGVLDAAQEKAEAIINGKSGSKPRQRKLRPSACSFATRGTGHRAGKHAGPLRMRRDGEDR